MFPLVEELSRSLGTFSSPGLLPLVPRSNGFFWFVFVFSFVYSILCALSVRSRFSVIDIMRGKAWRTVRLIITRWELSELIVLLDITCIVVVVKYKDENSDKTPPRQLPLIASHNKCFTGCVNCNSYFSTVKLFGDVCYHCNRVIEGDGECQHNKTHIQQYLCQMLNIHFLCFLCDPSVVSALNKAWCVSCFSCSTCNTKLTLK